MFRLLKKVFREKVGLTVSWNGEKGGVIALKKEHANRALGGGGGGGPFRDINDEVFERKSEHHL